MILSEKKGMECMTVSLDYFYFYQHFFSLLLTNILNNDHLTFRGWGFFLNIPLPNFMEKYLDL
jgi:hypothetical protein